MDKCAKITKDLEDEFVKNKNNCPKDVDAVMCMLGNLSNGNKKTISAASNIEGGLQFANAADVLCFKCGSDGKFLKNVHTVKGGLHVNANGGILKCDQQGTHQNTGDVWCHPDAVANVLSFSLV